MRRMYGRAYRPFQGSFTTTTSVVVPVYNEDPKILLRAITSYLANKIGEVILVVDHQDKLNIENIQTKFPSSSHPNVRLIVTEEPGKRPALARGISEAIGEIVVLSDSDTKWAENLLEEILKPFSDPEVAGVGAKQNVDPFEDSLVWRIENWLLDLRYIDKTVYQRTAEAYTVYSGGFGSFVRRKIRWSRNSYRANLRALWQGWVWRKSWILPVSIFHATITPYTLAIGVLGTAYLALTQPGAVASVFGIVLNVPLVWIVFTISGRSFKGLSHLRRVPWDISLILVMTFLMIFVLVPVKVFSLLTMNRQGWVGTR